MKLKNNIITIGNNIYILKHLTPVQGPYSCQYCDCRIVTEATATCIAINHKEKKVPCSPYTYFKKLTQGV